MQETAAKACRAPAQDKKVQIMSREYRGDFVVYTIASSSGCPGYFTYPFFYSEAYVYSVRTYFPGLFNSPRKDLKTQQKDQYLLQ